MPLFKPDDIRLALPLYAQAPILPDSRLQPYCQLYRLDQLSNLAQHRLGTVQSYGNTLCVQKFVPDTEPQGTVILVHGYLEHSALQQPLIDDLLAQNLVVLCFDLPGHGLSSGKAYWIDSFTRYGCQLGEILQRLGDELPGPWFMAGHSTGAAVVMAHQLMFGNGGNWPLAGRILLAPLVRPKGWRAIRFKYRLLRHFFDSILRLPSDNSHNRDYLRFIREIDPLQAKRIPVAWIAAMLAWYPRVEQADPMQGSVLVIQGTDDDTVDWQFNLSALKRCYPDLKVELIKDAKHQLINESAEYQQQLFELLHQSIRLTVHS